MRRVFASCAVLVGLLTVGAVAVPTGVAGANSAPITDTVYDSTTNVTSLPSIGYQATQAAEVGNQVTLAPSSTGLVHTVVVQMEDWACLSGSGQNDDCAGSGSFNQPITLNLYNVGGDGVSVGTPIGSYTQTFAIPYRPPADNTHCPGSGANGGTGQWYDGVACHFGQAVNVTFNLPDVQVPNDFIYGVAMNTSNYGANPYDVSNPAADAACQATEQGCPYDSLNIGLTQDPTNVTVGADQIPGAIYWNTQTAANYCDGGAGGTGTLRADLPLDYPPANPSTQESCWSVNGTTPDPDSSGNVMGGSPFYVPAVQFNTDESTAFVSAPSTTFTQGVNDNFSVLVNGYPDPTYSITNGSLPSGVSLTPTPPTTATSGTISGVTCSTGSFPVTLTADSSTTGSASQNFNLTVIPSTITSANSTTFTQTVSGRFQMSASPESQYTFRATGLPTGMHLSAAGLLYGTPVNSGTFTIPVTATPTDSAASCAATTQSFTLNVAPAAPRFTSANSYTATVGKAGSFLITTTGAPPATISSTSYLPAGIALTNLGHGEAKLGGTPGPHTGKVYNVTLKATSSSGSQTQAFTLTVDQAPLITSAAHISGPVGNHFNFTVTTSGYPPPAITSTALPPNVTLHDNGNGTATLSGFYLAGTRSFTFTASNGTTPNATQAFSMSGT